MRKRAKMARGSCLCGAVAFELVRAAGREMNCHCSRCRRAPGSVPVSNIFVDALKFRWVRGEEHVVSCGPPQECHFGSALCRSCGSALPRVVRSVGIVVVPSGTVESEAFRLPARAFARSQAAPAASRPSG